MSESEALARVRAKIVRETARWAQAATLDDIRESFAAFLEDVGGTPEAVRRQDAEVAGLPARWFIPQGAPRGAVVLYCHGGGFQIGSIRSHAALMARLARAAGLATLGFDYRLAPEHRFPAALEDVERVHRALLADGYGPILLAGDSAGGGLALAAAIRAREAGLASPGAIALLSPWLDLTLSGESYAALVDEDVFSRPDQLRAMARAYLGRGGDPSHREASPVFADLAGLPALLVHAGGADITLDDSRLLARRAGERGVACDLRIYPGMPHHFQIFADLPEAERSLAEMGAFLRARLLDLRGASGRSP